MRERDRLCRACETFLDRVGPSRFWLQIRCFRGLPQSQNIPQPDTILDGLGILYVLEGSTLGGQFIMRRLAGRFCVSPVFGGRFFSSYGPRVGSMWRCYVDVIERAGRTSDAADAIERSAVLAFQTFESWLSDATIRTEIEGLVEAWIGDPGQRIASSGTAVSREAPAFGAADLTNCDREPIHIPGSIQPHGALLALDPVNLTVAQAGGDTHWLFNVAPREMIGKPIEPWLSASQIKRLRELADGDAIRRPVHAFHLLPKMEKTLRR